MYISENASREEVKLKLNEFQNSLHPDKEERPTWSGVDATARKDVRDYESNWSAVAKGVARYPDLAEKALDIADKAVELKRKNCDSIGLYSCLSDVYEVRPDLGERILGVADKALANCKHEPYALKHSVYLLNRLAEAPQLEEKAIDVFSRNLNPALMPVEGKHNIDFMYNTECDSRVLKEMLERREKVRKEEFMSMGICIASPSRANEGR